MFFSVLLAAFRSPPDAELVRRFKSGDTQAFGLLYDRYERRIYSQCIAMLGNAETAEEIAQEVFVAAYKGLAKFRGDARFSTWLMTITINRCKNRRLKAHRRSEQRHESIDPSPDDEKPTFQPVSTLDAPDAATHRRQAAEQVRAALVKLSEEHREIILLRDFQDLDYPEIGEILGIARGTVKSRLSRARAELRRALGNQKP